MAEAFPSTYAPFPSAPTLIRGGTVMTAAGEIITGGDADVVMIGLASIADLVGQDRKAGPVMSTAQMASDLGAISGPLLAGLVVDAAGFGWAFALTGGILAVGAIAWAAGDSDPVYSDCGATVELLRRSQFVSITGASNAVKPTAVPIRCHPPGDANG